MQLQHLKGKAVAFAASGGLDSCTITRWLTDEGVDVVCCTANLAQPDEEDINVLSQRMEKCGAKEFLLLDAREELAEAGLILIQAQARYEGRYWNTAGIARNVIVKAMIPEMRQRNIHLLSHGATGRGNDQVRFQLAASMLANDIEVYAPWRDQNFLNRFRGRKEMIEFCHQRGLPIKASEDKPYSVDANLLGLTHEGGLLESLETPASFITPGMGCYPLDAPDKPEKFTVDFEKGRPVKIDGQAVSLVDAMLQANAIGGRHGISIGVHLVENRFVGIKSRNVYESPGMELLATCYGILLELILDRRARDLLEQLSQLIAKQVYQGYWYDLATQMALRAVERTAEMATGVITVSLYKGNISFVSANNVPHSLYFEEMSSMEAVGDFDHADSEGFVSVLSLGAKALSTANQTQK
jgi:argininosuccinate synthase